MSRLGWDFGGSGCKWRKRLIAWEEELWRSVVLFWITFCRIFYWILGVDG
jgi:hypothetical protein